MLGRTQCLLVVWLIVLSESLSYCQGREYSVLPMPTTPQLNYNLSGLNLPGHGSAVCLSSQPTSLRQVCFPVDPQSVAYGLVPGNSITLAGVQGRTSDIWQVFSQLEAEVVGASATTIIIFLIFLLRHRIWRFLLSSRDQQSSEFVFRGTAASAGQPRRSRYRLRIYPTGRVLEAAGYRSGEISTWRLVDFRDDDPGEELGE
jgi:hypothetical protein